MLVSTPGSAAGRALQHHETLKPEKKIRAREAAKNAPLLAALDLGTNNCRLLIARPVPPDDFQVVDSFSRIVRLGEGVGETGLLSPAAIERTIAALKICAERIAKHRAGHVFAIATQAARQATNTNILIARAHDEAGIVLEVISAEQEADLAALGCAPLIGEKYQGALIFDIGGGSTEIVWQHKRRGLLEKRLAASLPVGVVTLAEAYGPAALDRAGFETMRETIRARLAPLKEKTKGFDPEYEHLLGTSGTVTTLAALALKLPRYSRAKVDGSWHKTARLLSVVDHISRLDVPALAGMGAIGPERADLMLAGSAIFAAICSLWPSPWLRVADRGLREGMLRQMRDGLAGTPA
ncbi:MAG TPA: Ppx/GppA phosphatase family protein [Rhizomicrobium sp.]|jgi:exopolyphosphatase/guanosine-5'-triphosphate,3'-diphosphate pyrophosphatase|nr:Ppx/GppA phosphatase family protein [Rhizomicrobium sp.]